MFHLQEFEGDFVGKSLDEILQEQLDGFVYHDKDVILHLFNTMKELKKKMKDMDLAKKTIVDSSDDLLHTYNRTHVLFRARSPVESPVENSIRMLEENVELQKDITSTFSKAADIMNNSIRRLNQQIDRMTSAVVATISTPIVDQPSTSHDVAQAPAQASREISDLYQSNITVIYKVF